MKSFFLLGLALFAWNTSAQAATTLQALFEQHFREHYVCNRCTDNAVNFINDALNQGLIPSTSEVHLIGISTDDHPNTAPLGVNGEFAREQGPWQSAGEVNWVSHHAVVEIDGEIYDFDFGNEPEIVPTLEWIERQFLDENPNPYRSFWKIGRENKRNHYIVSIYDGRAQVGGLSLSASLIRELTLGEWEAEQKLAH